jgi:hypothetical protein
MTPRKEIEGYVQVPGCKLVLKLSVPTRSGQYAKKTPSQQDSKDNMRMMRQKGFRGCCFFTRLFSLSFSFRHFLAPEPA